MEICHLPLLYHPVHWHQHHPIEEKKKLLNINLTALADFEAEYEDELSFFKGDTLIFIRQHDSDWSVARCLRTGGEGMYPSGYAKWKFPKVQKRHYVFKTKIY